MMAAVQWSKLKVIMRLALGLPVAADRVDRSGSIWEPNRARMWKKDGVGRAGGSVLV